MVDARLVEPSTDGVAVRPSEEAGMKCRGCGRRRRARRADDARWKSRAVVAVPRARQQRDGAPFTSVTWPPPTQ